MSSSIRTFNARLYEEHLEEASFLYEQRRAYLRDPEVDWPALRQWEERIESHLDGLVVGGELAASICRPQLAGDADQLNAAVRVLCRFGEKALIFSALAKLDPLDARKQAAAADALCRELPRDWQADLLRAFDQSPQLTAIVAEVAGFRRFPFEEPLLARLHDRPAIGCAHMAWALGRIGSVRAVTPLWSLIEHPDERVREASAVALMRLGDERINSFLLPRAETQSWAVRSLAVGGHPRATAAMLDLLRSGATPDLALALGLHGDLAAVAPLLDLLDDEGLAAAAATALNTITGAQQYARVFVPDAIDPDELFDEERAAYERDGTLPTRHGKPYGNWERRPLLDRRAWRQWLTDNGSRFSRGSRWRMGVPYSPLALHATLSCPTAPYAVRRASYEELVIRFAMEIPFETELHVSRQARLLESIRVWAQGQSSTFQPGHTYFAGQPQS